MHNMDIVKNLEEIVAKHDGLIGQEASKLSTEYAIESYDSLTAAIDKIKKDGRLLKIGIVGKVKAGKSSLINALFFDGKSVLPKAATPMTAALSVLRYGEELSAKLDFFTQDDIDEIKENAKIYKKMIAKGVEEEKQRSKKRNRSKLSFFDRKKAKQKVTNNSKEDHASLEQEESLQSNNELNEKFDEEKAKKRVRNALKNDYFLLDASLEQEESLQSLQGVDLSKLEAETIALNSIDELNEKLQDYVGADGKFTPLTKSVEISFPNENLKDIEVVDTPGINDPVISREQRTRELLKECDVVSVVSPSGQFVSSEDFTLMDRIRDKEGINEIFVIASQIDNQLFADVKEKSGGDLNKACDGLVNELQAHLRTILNDKKDRYAKLIDKLEKKDDVFSFSSGVCLSIEKKIDDLSNLDENEQHAWNNLKRHYPDNFNEQDKETSRASLKMLANIDKINSMIDSVRDKKEVIIEEKIQAYIKAKHDNFLKYASELKSYVTNREEEINNGDVNELKKMQQKLEEIKVNVSGEVDDLYTNTLLDLRSNLEEEGKDIVGEKYSRAVGDISDAQSEEYKSYKAKSDYFGAGVVRFFGLGGYEERTKLVKKIDTYEVYEALSSFSDDVESELRRSLTKILKQWKNTIRKNVVDSVRKNVDDKDINISKLTSIIRGATSNIVYPEFSYGGSVPDSLKESGKRIIKDHGYGQKARDYVVNFKDRVNGDIKNYAKDLFDKLEKFELSKKFFDEYDKDIKSLQEQIENKQATLAEISTLKKRLQEIN